MKAKWYDPAGGSGFTEGNWTAECDGSLIYEAAFDYLPDVQPIVCGEPVAVVATEARCPACGRALSRYRDPESELCGPCIVLARFQPLQAPLRERPIPTPVP